MNEKWFIVFSRFASVTYVIFCETSCTYYGVFLNDNKIGKYKHYEPLTLEKIKKLNKFAGYTIGKEYESFGALLVDYPELIDL